MKTYTYGDIELYNMDCMDYMRGLPNNKFDICITSPPYNMNLRVNSKGDGYCSRQIVKEISTKYKNYSDNLPMQDYKVFLSDFIRESVRVSDLVFLNIQQITGNKPAIFEAIAENSHNLKETIIWDKCVSQPSIRNGVLNSQFEFIFVFGGNPIARQFKNCNFARGSESNVWKIPTERRSVSTHGAGYPVSLVGKIISLFGRDGLSVFDPFLGTGTTAIAAYRAGLEFFGTEIDLEYFNSAVIRIEQETAQSAMDFAL